MAATGNGSPGDRENHVADLMQNLNLTNEEEEVAEFSDEEDMEDTAVVDWALVGKVLSPVVIHATTIHRAMKPAWGNPHGLKIRSIREKCENLFVAEFAFEQDMVRSLGGSPWMVGKHALILQPYDESLRPSEICFDRMEIWVHILNLPLGWMNQHRGERAMGLVGEVKKLDVDRDVKASGPFLRARVTIDVSKAIRRGVLLKTKKDREAEWFDIQYEKLPFYCLSCGVMGHSELECDKPVVRNAIGRLPYDIKLRAPDSRKKKLQSFAEAAAESFGSSSLGPKHSRSSEAKNDEREHSGTREKVREVDVETTSPLKTATPVDREMGVRQEASSGRQLFQQKTDALTRVRKRKSKGSGLSSSATPDLNLPVVDGALVPIGLVTARVSQLGGTGKDSG